MGIVEIVGPERAREILPHRKRIDQRGAARGTAAVAHGDEQQTTIGVTGCRSWVEGDLSDRMIRVWDSDAQHLADGRRVDRVRIRDER